MLLNFFLFFILSSSSSNSTISVDEAIGIALSDNITIKVSQENILSAKANYSEALSAFLPTVTFTSTYTRFPEELTQSMLYFDPITMEAGYAETVLRAKATHETGFNLSWSLWAGGAKFANVSMKTASVRMKEMEFWITEEGIIFGTFSAYLGLIQADKAYTIAKEALDQSLESYKLTEALYRLGSVANLDLLRAEVQVSQNEGNLISANNSLSSAHNALNDILEFENVHITTIEPQFKDVVLPSLDSCYQIALNSPGLKIAEEAVNIARVGKRIVISSFIPSVSAFASYKWSGDYYEFGEPGYMGGIQFTWTIFSGTSRIHQLSSAASQERSAHLSLVDVKQQLLSTIEMDYLYVKSSIAEWEAAEKTLIAAEGSYNLVQRMYENGMVTSLELFEAQNTLDQAKLSEMMFYYSKYTTYAKLLSDMGILSKMIKEGGLYE